MLAFLTPVVLGRGCFQPLPLVGQVDEGPPPENASAGNTSFFRSLLRHFMHPPSLRPLALVCVLALVVVVASCEKPRAAGAFLDDYTAWTALPDDDAQRAAAAQLVSRWQGQQVRWPALAIASLCVSRAPKPGTPPSIDCAMNPFPRSDPKALVLGGTFPLYRFDAVTFAGLKAHCTGLSSCVVDVDARLSVLQLDPDLPLGITFTGPIVLAGRAPVPEDGWARLAPPQPAQPLALKVDPARALDSGLQIASPTF